MGTGTGKTPGRTVTAAGVVLFLCGIVAIGTLFLVPAVWDGHTAPLPVYLVAMCTPVGLFLAIAGTVRSGRPR